MRRLWTVVESFIRHTGGARSAMQESDRAIRRMTGLDPRHFHPRIYRAVREAALRRYDYHLRTRVPLTHEEVTMLKLVYLSVLARRTQDEARRKRLGGAIRSLKHMGRDRIRHEICQEATARTGF